MPGVPAVIERTRDKIMERGGNHGLRGIRRSFKIMDDSGDKKVSFNEFKYGLKDYGLRELTDIDFEMIWKFFDRDESGFVSFDEFLRGLRGQMSQRRVNLIGEAYDKLDRTGDGRVTVEDLSGVYDTSMHPDVLEKKATEEEVMISFMGQWDTLEKDGVVTFDEFLEYYKDVSCSIDEDDYFELMIRNAWHISGGEGAYANTTCRRVLVTHLDGSQEVCEIKNDLGLAADDIDGMILRLKGQGIPNIKSISLAD